jgi:Spy/CpxP family protein refolding chaperone
MDRICLFAVGTLMMFALTAGAQQAATAAAGIEKANHSTTQNSTDPVENHLKKLSQQLNLTPDQEDQIRPILQEMHNAMGKAEQNQSLSDDERKAQKHAAFMKADSHIRPILNDDQKKTLDQLEQQMHPEMHGK